MTEYFKQSEIICKIYGKLKYFFNKYIDLTISKLLNKVYYILNIYKIKKYNNQQTKRKNVVYTCISGPYDFIKNFKYFDENWDYVCYTNQEKLLNSKNKTIWKIYPMKYNQLDQIRNARWHKVFPNVLFGNRYEKSIWIDGNIVIKNKSFFKKIENSNKKFISAIHPSRNCIFDEAEACKKLKKDNPQIIDIQMKKIESLNYKKKMGLYESNIIYRNHNDEIISLAMEEWWFWIKNYSRRDQLSLNYICFKNKIEYSIFSKISYRKFNSEIKIVHH